MLNKIIQSFLFFTLTKRQREFEIKSLPVGLEISDGDRAALYGWPDITVEEEGN